MDNFWENLDRLSMILTILGVSLIPITRFLVEIIKSFRKNKENRSNFLKLNYQNKNLLSCFSGCVISVLVVVGFNLFSFWLYISLVEYGMPDYSIATFSLCVPPILVALLGGLIGLAIGKRYV
jgi:hypothetical protein